jgi:hypothetical protein
MQSGEYIKEGRRGIYFICVYSDVLNFMPGKCTYKLYWIDDDNMQGFDRLSLCYNL